MARNPRFKMSAADRRRLERHVQAGVQRKVAPGVNAQLRSDMLRMLNGMCAEFSGRSVDEVKPELVKRYALVTAGGSITDPELTQYAEEIAQGGSFQ